MERWAELVLRHRRWVMLFWVVVMVAGGALSAKVSDRLTVDFSLPGQPGTEAAHRIVETYGNGGDTTPMLATVTVPAGSSVAQERAGIDKAFAAVGSQVKGVRVVDQQSTGDDVFVTKDGRTAYAMVFYPFPESFASVPPDRLIGAALQKAAPDGAAVGVTGIDALATGDGDGGNGVLVETLIGALGALLVLLFVFASALAFLPLAIAAVSILFTFVLLLPLTYLTDVSFIVQFLIALVGLGVAIDYSLLLVTRWREERDHGRDNHDAVVAAMATAGHAVLFSGLTVAVGLLALVALPVPFLRSVGLGGALIPFASVLVTLTLTPAILGGIGPRVDWPKIRHENTASRAWSAWARLVVRHRWVAAGVALGLLAAMFVAFLGIKIGLPSSASLARSGPAYDTLQVLEQGGVSKGAMTPIEVLTRSDGAAEVARRLGEVSGVEAAVVPTGPGASRNGLTDVILIPDTETVNSSSVQVVRDVVAVADGLPDVVGVAGVGTAQVDFLHGVYGDAPLILAIIALVTFVLLVRAFRSLLLPLKAVLLNLVSLAAVYGVMVLFWQDGHGSETLFGIQPTGAVTFWIPMMLFAFLFGLSMDYEVFILARIREEYDSGLDTDEAVVEGIGRTGRLVTSAALILFLAFAALASGPGTDLKVMATGLGFGILLDATIVRSLLVPSLVSLFGSWNWYLPDGLAKILRVEPSHRHVSGEPVGPVDRDASTTAGS